MFYLYLLLALEYIIKASQNWLFGIAISSLRQQVLELSHLKPPSFMIIIYVSEYFLNKQNTDSTHI